MKTCIKVGTFWTSSVELCSFGSIQNSELGLLSAQMYKLSRYNKINLFFLVLSKLKRKTDFVLSLQDFNRNFLARKNLGESKPENEQL